MSTKEKILSLLETHREQAFSGEMLAQQLGISRAAVWKAIKELQKQGHCIEAVPNKGYTMCQTSEVLSEQGVRPYLTQQVPMLIVEKEVVSTNLTAKELAAQGAPHGTLVVADAQTGGRGRRGRSFSSPPGTGLYLTMLLRSNLPMECVVPVTSAAAVAVYRAIKKVCGKELEIKWVNDLYRNGKKCCGILTEAAADMESGGVDYVVVGTGLNLLEQEGGFPPELKNIAGAIFDPGESVQRCRIAAEIANELLIMANELPKTPFMKDYIEHNLVPGKDIFVIQNGIQRPAHACSITEDGHLMVKNEAGEMEELSFGEVSIRVK
ncbi:biotin--[acetyl-CoA-carboxylase] ligase [uncultured Ruthenibacterium sp.]|uniref:biotin--[acetyl-CoA-carboxylase] ligase n=1 Tax=uncultured Ruthenibacterium sp. TaxID=1905347 RepID=UPI00349EA2EE